MKNPAALAVLLSTCSMVVAQHRPTGVTIGLLEPSEIPGGAGCSYTLANPSNAKSVFAIPAELNEIALIRVNGVIHKLTRKSSKSLDAKGTRFLEQWSDGILNVTFRYRITGEGEGGIASEGQLTVMLGKTKKSISVRGGCGC